MALYIDEQNTAYPVTARKIEALCVQKGLLVVLMRNKVRMSLPLIIRDEEMERSMEILKEVLDEVMDYDVCLGGFGRGLGERTES
jgi:ornithine--oxo-acid transaminase